MPQTLIRNATSSDLMAEVLRRSDIAREAREAVASAMIGEAVRAGADVIVGSREGAFVSVGMGTVDWLGGRSFLKGLACTALYSDKPDSLTTFSADPVPANAPGIAAMAEFLAAQVVHQAQCERRARSHAAINRLRAISRERDIDAEMPADAA